MNSGKNWDDCEEHEICPIIGDTLCFDVSDPMYPPEWCYGEDGAPCCTAFIPLGTPPIPERDTLTIDMFEEQA